MIAAAREWLTSVVVVTLLLSVAQSLVPEGGLKQAASFTGGLILLLTLLRPLLAIDTGSLRMDFEDYGQAVRQRREELAENTQLAEVIAARTEAYIWDKADGLGLSVAVRVETMAGEDGVPLPWSAEVTGPWSQELETYMERELNIPRERQVWHEDES